MEIIEKVGLMIIGTFLTTGYLIGKLLTSLAEIRKANAEAYRIKAEAYKARREGDLFKEQALTEKKKRLDSPSSRK